MKLIRKGNLGAETPGLLLQDSREVDVSAFGEDFDEPFFDSSGIDRLQEWATTHADTAPEFPSGMRYGTPVARPSKIVCIGLNYKDHAEESGLEIPREPVIFFKATSAFCGPNDNLIIPRKSEKTDWEVELAFVIGKRASYVEESNALDHLAGYVLHNDYSEREFQIDRCGQWVKGKSCDSFAPVGPWLVTPDEIEDIDNLGMWLTLNGKTVQKSNTSNLVYKIPFLISYVSQFMTLLPGDIVSTGTPPGVGLGMDPPLYIKSGDVVKLGIDGLGESTQTAVNAS